jgi:transcriptional regulator with XRE-family HTH domain
MENEPAASSPIDERIARRLATLRADRGWTLDVLAERSGISRATLSRLERCELSPTAAMLNKLCAQYSWTISRLMAEAESSQPTAVRASDQVTWTDPETGYLRRMVSPPGVDLKGELVEVTLPAGAVVTYDTSPMPGLEHHLWIFEGVLSLDVEGAHFRLDSGDCVRYRLTGPSRFSAAEGAVRYLVAVVRP